MRRNQDIAARVCPRRTLLLHARQEGMLFGTTAEGARNANILDLRWNRPRFGLCGHFGRTVKTSITGNDFVANEVRRANCASSLLLAGVPCPLRRDRRRWVVCAFLPTGLSELRHAFLAAKSSVSFLRPAAK